MGPLELEQWHRRTLRAVELGGQQGEPHMPLVQTERGRRVARQFVVFGAALGECEGEGQPPFAAAAPVLIQSRVRQTGGSTAEAAEPCCAA